MMERKEKVEHPSYGMIRFCRVNGNSKDCFFGSDTIPPTYIDLEIKEGSVELDLGKNWYSAGKRLIKLKMTPVQFSELISCMNMGEGIPCTLEWVNGERVQQEEKESKIEFNQRKVKEKFNNLLDRITKLSKDVEDLKKSAPLNKEQRETIVNNVYMIKMEIEKNFPWYLEQYRNEMDNIALDVKSNLEASIMQKINDLGIQAFKDQYQQLSQGNEESI